MTIFDPEFCESIESRVLYIDRECCEYISSRSSLSVSHREFCEYIESIVSRVVGVLRVESGSVSISDREFCECIGSRVL